MIRYLLRLLARHKLRTAFVLVAIFGYSLLNGVSLAFLSPLLKVLFSGGQALQVPGAHSSLLDRLSRWIAGIPPMEAVQRLAGAIVFLFLLKSVFAYLQRFLTVMLQERIARDLRNELYDRVLQFPVALVEQYSTGEWVSRFLSDVNQVKNTITNGLFEMVKEGSNALVYLLIALLASWRLTLFAFVVVPVFSYLIVLIGRRIRKRSRRVQDRMADLGKHLAETLEGIRTVKGFGMEPLEAQRFRQRTRAFYRAFKRREYLRALGSPLTEFLSSLAAALILLYGARLIFVEHTLTPDRFFVFLAGALSLMAPFKRISNANAILQHGLGAGTRLLELLRSPERETGGTRPFPGLREAIVFDRVSFAYRPDQPVLEEVSFVLKKGQKIALVGPSGAGKTTIADLLLGFYPPTRGRILVDGVDLREYDLRSYRQHVALVPQTVLLFSGTVRDNIAYARPDATPEEVEQAAREAQAHPFIQRLPRGYDTHLGERATALSGGEKQRIALARAILRDAEIVVLDEATSHLDPRTDAEIQETLWRFLEPRTALIIAHRLSTVERADEILVIHQGRIACRGRHPELLQTCELYREFYALQHGGGAPREV